MGIISPLALWITLLIVPVVGCWEWNVRPSIVSHLLFILTLFLLQKYEINKNLRTLYFMPLIFLVWANCHLGFILGLATTSVTLLFFIFGKDISKTEIKRIAILLGVCFLVTLLNPHTYKLIPYFFQIAGLQQNDHIHETRSPNFHDRLTLPYQVIMGLLLISLTFQRKASLNMLFLTFGFFIASLHALRLSPYFAFSSGIVIGQQLNLRPDKRLHDLLLIFERWERGSCVPVIIIILVMSFAVATGHTSRVIALGFSDTLFPVKACNFAKQHEIPGNLWSDDYWGGYAIFSLFPRYKVCVDSRLDMYGDKIFFEMRACYLGTFCPDPNIILNKYQINWVLIRKETPLASFLENDKKWLKIYSDDIAVIFLRNTDTNRIWLGEHGPNL